MKSKPDRRQLYATRREALRVGLVGAVALLFGCGSDGESSDSDAGSAEGEAGTYGGDLGGGDGGPDASGGDGGPDASGGDGGPDAGAGDSGIEAGNPLPDARPDGFEPCSEILDVSRCEQRLDCAPRCSSFYCGRCPTDEYCCFCRGGYTMDSCEPLGV